MNEFVKVRFPSRRKVFVDGQAVGFTNKVFQVQTGRHSFNLGSPSDYCPDHVGKDVVGTCPDAPLIITFTSTLLEEAS